MLLRRTGPYSNSKLKLNSKKVFCLFVPSLSSCHEKATVALYFGRILICLGVADIQVFWLLLLLLFPLNLLLVRKHQAEIIVAKRGIQGRNISTRVGVEPRTRVRDHTVAIKTALYLLGHAAGQSQTRVTQTILVCVCIFHFYTKSRTSGTQV